MTDISFFIPFATLELFSIVSINTSVWHWHSLHAKPRNLFATHERWKKGIAVESCLPKSQGSPGNKNMNGWMEINFVIKLLKMQERCDGWFVSPKANDPCNKSDSDWIKRNLESNGEPLFLRPWSWIVGSVGFFSKVRTSGVGWANVSRRFVENMFD